METVGELKTMVSSYARQETVEPLKALGKWVGIGMGGAVFIILGLFLLSLAVLRFFQSEFDTFDNNLSFIPYLIAAVPLLIGAIAAAAAAKRTFDDDRS